MNNGISLYPKPKVLISKCIGFEACRYDNLMVCSPIVEKLKNYVEAIAICPEVEIGLKIPRDPIRIVKIGDKLNLIQPSTKNDYTKKIYDFSINFLTKLKEIDGAILKRKSPTCGIKDAKIFVSVERDDILSRGSGFFAKALIELYPYLPIEDEKRLLDANIREDFCTRIFALSRFHYVKEQKSNKIISDFHRRMKYLLMAYNEKEMRTLGRIIAYSAGRSFSDLINDYSTHFYKILSKPAKISSHINVLNHIAGYFKKQLNKEEKTFINDRINEYRDNKILLSDLLKILKEWAITFNVNYIIEQYYLDPFPYEIERKME